MGGHTAPARARRPGRSSRRARPGGARSCAREIDVPEVDAEELLPARFGAPSPPRLPEVSEPEIVRHYVGLSKRNFDLDSGFYPLGSCTMKHNPRLHERAAALPGHARLHPLQDPERAQGALELMWNLQGALSEISGLPHVSLQPSAGSHGELAGVLLTRAYHEDRGETRHKVLTPDTAHGTNPATVTMAGLEVVKVATNADGGVDLDDLRAKADARRRLPDAHQPQHARAVRPQHRGDRRDRARRGRDALLRRRQPQRGHGPLAARRHGLRHRPLQPAQVLHPAPRRRRPRLRADRGLRPHRAVPAGAAGRAPRGRHVRPRPRPARGRSGGLRGFHGNYGCFVRSYAYICSLGADGLKDASETAVLNANYLLARLREQGVAEYLPLAYGELCMHEFVLSGGPMKRELKIKTLDLAKRLLDFGFHPPTVYFPLLVEEALMVEPTETETTRDARRASPRRSRRSCARRPRTPRSRAGRALHHARAPPGRGRRRQAPRHPRGARLGARWRSSTANSGSTGVSVSPLCLGAMMFGAWGNTDHEDSIRIIHRALDAGINFIDTADVYSRGESEEIVGKALAGGGATGRARDQGPRARWATTPTSSATRAAGSIAGGREQPAAPENRLDRPLPDPPPRARHRHRRDARRAQRPRARRQGPLHRQLDVPRPQIVEAQWVAERRGRERFAASSRPTRCSSAGSRPTCCPSASSYGMGVIPWSPLAGGWLSGRYRKDGESPGSSQARADAPAALRHVASRRTSASSRPRRRSASSPSEAGHHADRDGARVRRSTTRR